MKKIKYILAVLGVVGGLSFAVATPSIVSAYDPCDGDTTSLVCQNQKSIPDTIKIVINVILYVLGSLAVIMIIYSGMLYVMSGGDENNVKKAKSTLMYSVIGLIVALLAYAIVNFVITTFK